MSLLSKTANVMHKNHGYFVSDGWKDAPVGFYGYRDGDRFEPVASLKSVNKGVPDPNFTVIERTPRWFMDQGVSASNWKVGAGVPGGLVGLSVTLDFDTKYGIAVFLAKYSEVRLKNPDPVGDALVELYRDKGNDWKLNRKWVYSGLKVETGFVVMGLEKDTKVTLEGRGIVDVSGVPVSLDIASFQGSRMSSIEFVGLDGITPFVNLAEVYDSAFKKADWRPFG